MLWDKQKANTTDWFWRGTLFKAITCSFSSRTKVWTKKLISVWEIFWSTRKLIESCRLKPNTTLSVTRKLGLFLTGEKRSWIFWMTWMSSLTGQESRSRTWLGRLLKEGEWGLKKISTLFFYYWFLSHHNYYSLKFIWIQFIIRI